MSEEMKLITALCEALGFEVVVERDYQEQKEGSVTGAMKVIRRLDTDNTGRYVTDSDGLYTSRLIDPITTYTVTKTAKED